MSPWRRFHRGGPCHCRSHESDRPVLGPSRLLGTVLMLLLSIAVVAVSGCSPVVAPESSTPAASKADQPTSLPSVIPSATAMATQASTATPGSTATSVPTTAPGRTATPVPAPPTPTPRPEVLGPNLLPNPSFEDMVDGLPDGWTVTPRNAPIHEVRPGNNGQFAVGFSKGISETNLLLLPKNPIPVTPGLTYKFIGWARGGGLSKGCAQVAFRGASDGNAVCFADAPKDGGTNPVPYAWTRAAFTVTIPEGVTAIDFSLVSFWTGDAAAQVYWDDLYFGELVSN
jgi:hypothetical protein